MSFYEKTNDDIIITLSFYLAASYRLVPSINKIFILYNKLNLVNHLSLKLWNSMT